MLELHLKDITQDLKEVLSSSAQGLIQKYKNQYIIKLRDTKQQIKYEIKLLTAAGDLGMNMIGYIYTGTQKNLERFVMPLLQPIDVLTISLHEKMTLFYQICFIITTLHQCGIIHGDMNLSNILLDIKNSFKLCDFGIIAFATETHFPSVFTVYSISPYRLRKKAVSPLIPQEDEYALGIAV